MNMTPHDLAVLENGFDRLRREAGIPNADLDSLIEHHRVDAAATLLAKIQAKRPHDVLDLNVYKGGAHV